MRIAFWIIKATNIHTEYETRPFQGNSGYTSAPRCYVKRTSPLLLQTFAGCGGIWDREHVIGNVCVPKLALLLLPWESTQESGVWDTFGNRRRSGTAVRITAACGTMENTHTRDLWEVRQNIVHLCSAYYEVSCCHFKQLFWINWK
jgi:hypothetical protein